MSSPMNYCAIAATLVAAIAQLGYSAWAGSPIEEITNQGIGDLGQVLRESEKSIDYLINEIPYPVRFDKNSDCNFNLREINLIQDALAMLPAKYQTIPSRLRIEKRCELSDPANVVRKDQTRLAYAQPEQVFRTGRIVLLDRVFNVVIDQKLRLLNEAFSRKIIIHELTHMLDFAYGLSKTASFRQINQWSHNAVLAPKPNLKRGDGFYRDQYQKNPAEDLASSAEGYFVDPDFICHQPAMYTWFSVHLGPSQVTPMSCPDLDSPIIPENTTGVGYVWVSATNKTMESRFGHAMLHFHDKDSDPFNDVLVQAAGSYPGQPVFTGFESEDQLREKEKNLVQVSRTKVLLNGAFGQLDLVVQPMHYKSKWIDTTVIEGRDIREKILDLSPKQLRAMIYIINRDMQREMGKYKFLKSNCATYVGETLNKVFATELVHPTLLGIYTPNKVYKEVAPITAKELPVIEGDATRLARQIPKRLELIEQLQEKEPAFAKIPVKALKKVGNSENSAEATASALDQLVAVAGNLAESDQLAPTQRKTLMSLIYTYTLERHLGLKGHATKLYKEVARMRVRSTP